MEGRVKNIILTADYLEKGRTDYENLNTDVIVQFESGAKYIAPFISCKNLENVVHELEENDKANGLYRILSAVLIKDLNPDKLAPIIEAMLAEGDFQLIFKKM
jgi:hypothetical protein